MDKDKSHQPISASSISKSLSNKRTSREKSKKKPRETPSLLLNVTEGAQTHSEEYTIKASVVSFLFECEISF